MYEMQGQAGRQASQHAPESLGCMLACMRVRAHRYHASARVGKAHSKDVRSSAPQSRDADSSAAADEDVRGDQKEDPWTMFHLWSEANCAN